MNVPPGPFWEKLCQATDYTSPELSEFAKAEGYPTQSSYLSPFQKAQLKNIVLCRWSVREGYFKTLAIAEEEFFKFWRKIRETDLISAWIDFCQDREHLSKTF